MQESLYINNIIITEERSITKWDFYNVRIFSKDMVQTSFDISDQTTIMFNRDQPQG